MMRNGKRHGRFFADSKSGSKKAALAAAKIYRDSLVARRPARVRAKPRPLMVVRGGAQYCQIRIPRPDGTSTTTEFSARRHGMRKARQMALEAYEAAKAKLGE